MGIGAVVAVTGAIPAEEAAAAKRPQCVGARATQLVDPMKLFAVGTQRDDVISGTPGNEKIIGRRGNDRVCAHAGRDLLKDGPGADRVRAGSGRDKVRGGKGKDHLSGGTGRDRVKAADGARDRVKAGKGRDKVKVRDGVKDSVNCGPGRDAAAIDNLDTLKSCESVTLGGTPDFALPSWSDGLWSDPSTYETIRTGDIDGDGLDELVGRSPFGIEAYRFDGATGQWLPLYNGAFTRFSDETGWSAGPWYYSTIQLGDVNGDGADELLARAGGGMIVYHYDPGSASWEQLPTLPDLSDANGWTQQKYYSTIQTANLVGGDEEEVFARGPNGVEAWRLVGDSWQNLASAGPWDDAGGWGQPRYYATIHAANLLGDDHVELYGRASDGIHVYQLTASGWSWIQAATNPDLADSFGWSDPSWYPTIQAADFDGDGYDDLLGRAGDGVHSWHFGNGRWNQFPVLPAFEDSSGGNQPQSYSTIQTARLTPAPLDVVVGRGPDGLEAYIGPATDWARLPVEGDLSDSAGWANERYYATIRSASVAPGGTDAIVARGLAGAQSYAFERARNAWGTLSQPFPPYDSGEEGAAYQAINQFIGGRQNPSFDLRKAYPTASGADLAGWQNDKLPAAPKPASVSDAVWNEVKTQLTTELTNAQFVLAWYDDASGSYLHTLVDDKFLGLSMDTSADVLKYSAQSDADLAMQEWDVFEGVLEGLGGLAVIEGPAGDAAVIATSLVGGASSAGIGGPGVQAAIDGIEGDYIALRNRLNDDFQTALKGIGDAKIAIQGDYGLQSAVGGELIGSGFWTELTGDPRATALAEAERNYDVSAWQTITPGIWTAFRFPPNQVGNWCDSGEDYPAGNCEWRPPNTPDGTAYTLAYPNSGTCSPPSSGPCRPVQQGLTNTLFGPTSDSCEEVWDLSTCGMGVPQRDVFLGLNGWGKLPLRACVSRNNPRAPSAINCSQTRP